MRYSLDETDDDTLRRIVGVWKLTWFSAVTLTDMDENGDRKIIIETDDTWSSAPESLRQWFATLDAKTI